MSHYAEMIYMQSLFPEAVDAFQVTARDLEDLGNCSMLTLVSRLGKVKI
jgi:hypothetical protein